MNIAVAGTGYVGLVSGVCLSEVGHNVVCVDTDENKIEKMKSGISPIYEQDLEELMKKNYKNGNLNYTTNYENAYKNADVIFICVGTPENPDNSANLDFVNIVAKQIANSIIKDCIVVIKSTVPVGTCDKIEKLINDNVKTGITVNVASNPEFLAQGSAVHDTLHAKRIVFGTEKKEVENIMMDIYKPFNIPIISVKRRSSEMIKYACNNFLALKISYMNDIANLCELVGADIEDVANGMKYDPRIGNCFLNAGIGYGGSCFPKDTKALKYLAKENGYTLKTVEATIDINTSQKIKLYEKSLSRIKDYKNLKVAILGLTFKPGTDDLRESPSIDNVKLLLKNGANIYAYDPVGINNFKKLFPSNIKYSNTPEEALKDADVCFIFTEWDEIKNIKPCIYKSLMKTPLVYDGRNIYNVNEMRKANIEYFSIGRN